MVGGGNTAVGDALYLSRIAKKVHLIHRRDTLRADAVYVSALPAADNVEFHGNAQVRELHAADGSLASILVEHAQEDGAVRTETLAVDALFVAVGSSPNAQLFADSGVERDVSGYIVADETGKTSIPGFFVAGDLRTKALRQVITAASDGANAATSAFEYLSLTR